VGIDRRGVTRWSGIGAFALFVGVISGLAAFGLVIMPLFFFAAVTEPSAGTHRPLFRVGSRVAVVLGIVVALVAAGIAGWWRARPDRDVQAPGA
jgi:uncharacterized membrane protein YphA (DoxX/SURF4 family)